MLPISKDKATLLGYLQKWKHWQVERSSTSLETVFINLKEAKDNATTKKLYAT